MDSKKTDIQLKEVTKQEFYNSKYINDPRYDSVWVVDHLNTPYPWNKLLKLKRNHKIVGMIRKDGKYFLNV